MKKDGKIAAKEECASLYSDEVRTRQGMITGLIGLLLNLLLGGGKLAVGLLSGSAAIVSDAVNNFSDAGNSVVAVSSFVLGSRKADKEHPYGHGRYEYIASLLIGMVIVLLSFEFILSAIGKIRQPQPITLSAVMMAVLGVSVVVKLFMGIFYRIRAAKINSDTLRAASWDSFFDCIVTSGVVIGTLLTLVLPNWIDGVFALAVSLVILFGGVKLLLGTIKRLLGEKCDADTAKKISDLVCSDPLVLGSHDLHVHDYGPNRMLASVHAEFDKNVSMIEAHAVIDVLEHRAYREMGVELVVHCDPVDSSDLTLNRVRHTVKDIIRLYDGASMHELEILYEAKAVSFHLKLREKYLKQRAHLVEVLTEEISRLLPDFVVMIEVDVLYE